MANITLQSIVLPGWNDLRTNVELWIFSDGPWTDVDNIQHGAGSPANDSSFRVWTQRITGLTVNTTAKTLTVPSFQIKSTTDALVNPNVRYYFHFMAIIGVSATPIKPYPNTEGGIIVPSTIASISGCSPIGTCAIFTDLIYASQGRIPVPLPRFTYSDSQIDAKITAIGSVSPLTTKGDLYTRTGTANARLPVATDGFTLFADSTQTTGLRWGTAASGDLSSNTSSSTDSEIALFSGTAGKTLKRSTGVATALMPSVLRFQNATTNEGYWASTGGTFLLAGGADSSVGSPNSSGNPSETFQTYRSGGSAGVGVFGYQFAFYKLSGSGDSYGLAHLNYYAPDMSGFTAGNYFQHGLMGHVVLNPTNIPGGAIPYGFNWFKTEKLTPNCYTVGAQLETVNNSGADAATDGNSANSAVACIIAGGGTKHNSIGIMWQAGQFTSFQYGIWAQANSIHGIVADYSNCTYVPQGTVAVNNGSANWVGTGSNYNPEIQVADFVTLDGSNWYEVATRTDDTHFTTTTVYGQANTSGQTITKVVQPLRLLRPSYILATDTVSTFKLLGMNGLNQTIIDGSGTGLYAGSSTTQITNTAGQLLSAALKGTATNDSAAAGIVGEYASSSVASGSAITLTSGVTSNLTSVSLTAGDWDVWVFAYFVPAGTVSVLDVGVSQTSATFSFTNGDFFQVGYPGLSLGNTTTMTSGPTRVSLSGTTTLYAVVASQFGTGMTCYGLMRARRVR